MDPARVSLRQGAIALFDGNLPVALRGAGSRRLMVMAAHKASVKEGAIILIDEIENSLEPYRLRNLIRQLRPNDTDNHQVIFTTHSPVAVVECHSTELCVVRSKDSTTTIKAVGEHLQSVVRNIPEAFLVRKVIVCEGKTEAGLLISLDRHYWQQRLQNNPSGQSAQFQTMAEAGVAPIESPKSGGSAAPKYAVDLAGLGYRVAYFGDSDLYLKPSSNEMMGSGVEKVLIWSGNVEIERRLCFDLPWKGVTELVALAIRLQGSDASVWDKIYGTLQKANLRFTRKADLDSLRLDIEEIALRESIGKAADDGEWFKRMDKGKALGIMLASYLDDMQDTPTCENLQDLARWSYVG
jgi:hypothetical protein